MRIVLAAEVAFALPAFTSSQSSCCTEIQTTWENGHKHRPGFIFQLSSLTASHMLFVLDSFVAEPLVLHCALASAMMLLVPAPTSNSTSALLESSAKTHMNSKDIRLGCTRSLINTSHGNETSLQNNQSRGNYRPYTQH